MEIKAVVWDWGRTLFDSETKQLFPEALKILDYCRNKGYRNVLATLVTKGNTTIKERQAQIIDSGLASYFEKIEIIENQKDLFDPNVDEKNIIFDKLIKYLDLPVSEIIIIGDRVYRDIKYAARRGHPSVWIQKGKFANQLPNDITGHPTYTIQSLEEIKNIL